MRDRCPCNRCGKLIISDTSPERRRCQSCRRVEPQPAKGRDTLCRSYQLKLGLVAPTRPTRPTCEVCGNGYRKTYTQQRTCGRKCGSVINSRTARQRTDPGEPAAGWPKSKVYPIECAFCGTLFIGRATHHRICPTPACKTKLKQQLAQKWAQAHPDKITDSAATRRAMKRMTPYEPITRTRVFIRDKWRCQLCRRKVNPTFTWPHPDSATLDHVLPLSQGGTHTYQNVQLAHARCNTSKGAHGGNPQQLTLFG